jgi:glycerophosphoryl diester phosphodiesterase
MPSTQPSPILFGHRGASLHAPENTLAAFKLAYKYGADGIELDAKLSKDGQVIVIHDAKVDRTCDGSGAVREMTFNEIRNLDAGRKFDPKFKGEKIPSLDEVFETLGKKLLINVELTNYADPKDDLPEKVTKIVKKHKLENDIIFSSFHPTTLRRIQKLLPETPAGLLAFSGLPGALSRSFIGKRWSPKLIHPYYSDVTESFVIKEKRWGRKINVWTVDDKSEMERLIHLGINGIITDDIPLAIQVRKALRRN